MQSITLYPDMNNIRFPSLDDDTEPENLDLLQLQTEDTYKNYYSNMFSLAEHVPLPLSPTPADNVSDPHEKRYPDLNNIRFPSLDDEVDGFMSLPVSVMPSEVPLPPSPTPADIVLDSHDKRCPDLKDFDCASLDEEVAFFMSGPFCVMPWEVPLPPSPTPTDTACDERCFQEDNYPHSSCTCFSSVDEDVPKLMDLNQLAEIPLPPSPTPADTLLHVGHSHEENNQDWEDFEFPSLDDEAACLMSRPVSVPLSSSPSLDDNAEAENPDLLQLQTEAYKNYSNTEREWNERCFQEENYLHSSCMCFSSLDEDIPELMSLSKLAEIPLPPSPTPA